MTCVCVQISDQYFTALTPAGYAFSIWLVIWGVQLTAVIWLLYRPDDSDTTVPSLPHPQARRDGILCYFVAVRMLVWYRIAYFCSNSNCVLP